ncbi:MAG: hypothetical protein ABIQ73_11690 [Acidimicrobiales bacterium]
MGDHVAYFSEVVIAEGLREHLSEIRLDRQIDHGVDRREAPFGRDFGDGAIGAKGRVEHAQHVVARRTRLGADCLAVTTVQGFFDERRAPDGISQRGSLRVERQRAQLAPGRQLVEGWGLLCER